MRFLRLPFGAAWALRGNRMVGIEYGFTGTVKAELSLSGVIQSG
ncbi:Uncharacterised protein [Vibrio cholerae]|uniref:Uncharacterized protein n=1 Tax=Vibrio cholerae TaxID=666 RepID=A0A655VVW9_VIBCL|nr:Uncharacterised protein [Vibrio cholerae]